MFKCEQIQDDYYLVADYRIKCFVGVWWGYALVAAAGAILYTIGIPVGLFLLLRKNRQHLYLEEIRKKNDDDNLSNHALVVRKYGAIYSAYNPNSYFFDLLDMVRRLMLTGGLILLGQTSNVQIFLGGLLCTCWLLVVAVKRPYVAYWDNALSVLLSFQLLIIILSGMALEIYRLTPVYAQDVYQRNAFGVFMVIACIMVIVAVVLAIVISIPLVRNRFLKCYQKYMYKKEQRKKDKDIRNSSEKQTPSKGGQMKDEEKRDKVHEMNEVDAKELILQETKKMKASFEAIQSCLGSINTKNRDALLKMVTTTMKAFVSENVKKKAMEAQAQVQAQVKTFAKKNVSGMAVMNAIKSKTNSVKNKYLWSGSEKEKEEQEKQELEGGKESPKIPKQPMPTPIVGGGGEPTEERSTTRSTNEIDAYKDVVRAINKVLNLKSLYGDTIKSTFRILSGTNSTEIDLVCDTIFSIGKKTFPMDALSASSSSTGIRFDIEQILLAKMVSDETCLKLICDDLEMLL